MRIYQSGMTILVNVLMEMYLPEFTFERFIVNMYGRQVVLQ